MTKTKSRNAYTYGRPVNIEGARSSVRPLTLDDDDGVVVHTPGKSADISCFIALCRLSTILESLLPLLLDRENDPLKQSTERAVLNQAARDMETMFRDLPEDLVFKPGVTHPCRPGSCKLQSSSLPNTRLSAARYLWRQPPNLPIRPRAK